jgi:hypothetical protein
MRLSRRVFAGADGKPPGVVASRYARLIPRDARPDAYFRRLIRDLDPAGDCRRRDLTASAGPQSLARAPGPDACSVRAATGATSAAQAGTSGVPFAVPAATSEVPGAKLEAPGESPAAPCEASHAPARRPPDLGLIP